MMENKTQIIDETNADIHQGGFIGGFYIRPMELKYAGDTHKGHDHFIDHMSNIQQGRLRIDWKKKDGGSGHVIVLVPCKILIKANVWHKFTALSDDVRWECIFSEAEAEKAYGGFVPPKWYEEKPHG